MRPDLVTLDFETEAIQPRPNYPPEPAGLAVRWSNGHSEYWAWGHPTDNNCSFNDALQMLEAVWRRAFDGTAELIFHNAKFDISVAHERLGLPIPPWQAVHDTMFLAFLIDPHSKSVGLKELCAEFLSWPAEEQDELFDWLWEHRAELTAQYGGKITKAKSGPNSAGAWISKAPGRLVGKYAVGDVERTWALFDHFMPIVEREGMSGAYDRKRALLPLFLENERDGMRCDTARLEDELEGYQQIFDFVEETMRRRLDAPGLNFDADRDVADVLSKAGAVDDDKWQLTPSGQKSVSKDNLTPDMFNDRELARLLGYRNRLKTCMEMFMRPWLRQAKARGGWISTNWNQVRGGNVGTRTGRPSTSNPNFLNISKDFEGKGDGYEHPQSVDIWHLPLVRRYILPDEGGVFLHRDFDGQEMRIFAHFECGDLMRAYRQNPGLDPHGWVKDAIGNLLGEDLDRGKTKILNFQAMYGGGVSAAAKQLGCNYAEAKQYKNFHDKALPGRKILNEEITRLVRRGEPITTWGGRKYFPEPPKDGRDFTYKLINYLIQGSAADITEETLRRWYEAGTDARFLVTVYDEADLTAPKGSAREEMLFLKDIMENIELDVPMRSSGKWGPNWGELEEFDDPH